MYRKYEVARVSLPEEETGKLVIVGLSVINTETGSLDGTLLYAPTDEEGARARRTELENADLLKANWPDARDPDVQSLLADPEFEPADESSTVNSPMHRFHKAAEIVARRRAGLDQ